MTGLMATSQETCAKFTGPHSHSHSSRKMLQAAHGLARAAEGVDRVGPRPPLGGAGQLALHGLVDALHAGQARPRHRRTRQRRRPRSCQRSSSKMSWLRTGVACRRACAKGELPLQAELTARPRTTPRTTRTTRIWMRTTRGTRAGARRRAAAARARLTPCALAWQEAHASRRRGRGHERAHGALPDRRKPSPSRAPAPAPSASASASVSPSPSPSPSP